MRAVVTGGAGFIGSHIVDRLMNQGADILVIDDLSTGNVDNLPQNVELAQLDIRDDVTRDLIKSYKPSLISHCAAQASVPSSMKHPGEDASVNIVGGIKIASAAAESSCSTFIYINTGGALYGEPDYLPCDENHPIRPASAYGLSKWTFENYIPLIIPKRIKSSVLRLANVYGTRQDNSGESGVVSIFALQMLRNEPVTIFGNGEQTRDFVHVSDVAKAHDIIAQCGERTILNIGTGIGTSINNLFEQLAKLVKYTKSPIYLETRPGDIQHIVLDSTRAKSLLGWEPKTLLDKGLHNTVQWIEKHL